MKKFKTKAAFLFIIVFAASLLFATPAFACSNERNQSKYGSHAFRQKWELKQDVPAVEPRIREAGLSNTYHPMQAFKGCWSKTGFWGKAVNNTAGKAKPVCSSKCISNSHNGHYPRYQTIFLQPIEIKVQEDSNLGAVAHLAALKGRVPFIDFFDGSNTSAKMKQIKLWGSKDIPVLVNVLVNASDLNGSPVFLDLNGNSVDRNFASSSVVCQILYANFPESLRVNQKDGLVLKQIEDGLVLEPITQKIAGKDAGALTTTFTASQGLLLFIPNQSVDHVLAAGKDLNVFVFELEKYSNIDSRAFRAANLFQANRTAQFSAAGKETKKKDLSEIAMSYGYVYVAQVAMGANPAQTIKPIIEAEAYNGPSIIFAYAPCIQ